MSYIDDEGYHVINTNNFNNSIDNMLYDYQGNLWFTSSRLGLLRLAKSPFTDIYGSIGMDRRVVNAIVSWQDKYYIGTDKGLDVVDKTCSEEIENSLTRALDGKRIRCMYVDDDGHLWVCTYGNGLMEFAPNGQSWEYNAENGSFGSRARIVNGLSDGTILAAGDTGISFIKDHEIIRTIKNEDDMIAAAKVINGKFGCSVLCKGGHQINDANDLLYRNGGYVWFKGKRIDNPNTHGTGCTLSSAIASNLAKGCDLDSAVKNAKDYISGALAAMMDLGKGSGPLCHNYSIL